MIRFRALGSLDLRAANGDELRSVLVQPKRLALLAYLALANPLRLHRRDTLVALFWPEATGEQARGSLRQALHFLRHELGAELLESRGDNEVGVNPGAFWCDAREFERALDGKRPDEALALYRGELLEGFHVSGIAPEFEQWLEAERSRLRGRAVEAVSQLASEAERTGNPALAIQRLRELLRIEPGSERGLKRLAVLLEQSGDRAGALRAYDDFARRLAADLEVEPSAELQALARRLRSPGPAPRAAVTGSGEEPAVASGDRPGGRRLTRVAVAGGILLAALGAVLLVRPRAESLRTVVLAVGAVDDRTGSDSVGSARVLRDLLATDLARVPGIMVVSQARMQELLARLSGGEESRATLTRAAQSAGAAEVLEGELYRRAGDTLRLDVRRVVAGTGVIRRAYTVEGRDLFALVERMSERLAAEVGQPAPSPSLANLTTTSLVARRFYEEGLRLLYRGDYREALQHFHTALSEDSTFAMAAYYGAVAAGTLDQREYLRLAAQAVRMSRHATERERLLVAMEWAWATNSPSMVPVAESLAGRYPLEPDAQLALPRALTWSGDFRRAIPHLERAAQLDSASLTSSPDGGRQRPARCTECEVLANLVFVYIAIDSSAAAEHAARELVRRKPRSVDAWSILANTFGLLGKPREALAAYRSRQTLWQELSPGELLDDAYERAQALLRAGDFAEVDQTLADRSREGTLAGRIEALWWRVLSLRNQGRLIEALRLARRQRELAGANDATARLAEAQVLFELGRAAEAATGFAGSLAVVAILPIPVGAPDSAPGRMARTLVWHLTHIATATAAAGDTVRLARLADSVAALGPQGAYGRDRKMPHYLRGLLSLARGRREEAVDELARAIYSPTIGYTRINLELGKLLLALGRPREAAAVLGPALRGDLQASNFYVTHAELHEMLAQAFESSGQADSARVHYAWVANAWQDADPPFRARATRARAKSKP